jgi:hypothetical protein
MVMLSDIALTNGLVWTDRWGSQSVAQSMLRTLGGLPVFYSAKLNKGVAVTLESLPDQGWQTLETVAALYDLASVAGAQYLLDFGPIQFSVMFRHDDGPAFEATPLIPRTLADAGDYFTIKLKLVTV